MSQEINEQDVRDSGGDPNACAKILAEIESIKNDCVAARERMEVFEEAILMETGDPDTLVTLYKPTVSHYAQLQPICRLIGDDMAMELAVIAYVLSFEPKDVKKAFKRKWIPERGCMAHDLDDIWEKCFVWKGQFVSEIDLFEAVKILMRWDESEPDADEPEKKGIGTRM